MAVIEAYIDDSGNSDGNGNPVFVLGGYISSAERWTAFAEEWAAECNQHPKILNFKMAHANAFRGDFDRWDRQDRDARLAKLAAIIRRHTVLRIQCSMGWGDYNTILRGKLPGLYDSPYVWIFWKLISELAEWQMTRGLCQKVDFIFDDQGAIGAEAVYWLQAIKENSSAAVQARIGSVVHRHDDEVMPLKAADMWAWHVRRYLAEGIERLSAGQPVQPHTDLMKGLMHCESVGTFLDTEDVLAIRTAYLGGVSRAVSEESLPWQPAGYSPN